MSITNLINLAVLQVIRVMVVTSRGDINRFKKGKTEVPLCEGFVWIYAEDEEQYSAKVKAWIALNAADNRKTHI